MKITSINGGAHAKPKSANISTMLNGDVLCWQAGMAASPCATPTRSNQRLKAISIAPEILCGGVFTRRRLLAGAGVRIDVNQRHLSNMKLYVIDQSFAR